MTEALTETLTEPALFELLSLECRVDGLGSLRYYNAQGQLHRVYGPAVVRPNGGSEWWQNGRRHRIDGPAVEHSDGRHEWHFDGKELTKAEWQQEVASMETV